jgi:hypothetical protein
MRPLNRLLLALPSADLARLMPDLEQVSCRRGDVLLDADYRIDHVFFPDNCVISVVAVYTNGDVALVAIPAMRYLAFRKIAIAERIGSRALRADAMEAVTCGWLSFVVVASLAVQWLFGAWWIDSIGSLLIKEGREAWAAEECGCC